MTSYTFTYRQLAAFKNQWPCNGIPDEITLISFTYAGNGDLVDYEFTDDDGRAHDIETSEGDGRALLALSEDGWTLANGGHVPYLND